MKYLSLFAFGLGLVLVQGETPCVKHALEECNKPGDQWSDSPHCNSIHGGFQQNVGKLEGLLANHLRDSFKYLIMSSHFESDAVNKIGFQKLFKDNSDKMWNRAKSLLKYMIKRGGSMTKSANVFNLNDVDMKGSEGMTKALATSLDMMKQNAAKTIEAYHHSQLKKAEANSYDPAISHYLEKNLIQEYADDIRHNSGLLNVWGKIAKVEKSRNLGAHLFDKSLK